MIDNTSIEERYRNLHKRHWELFNEHKALQLSVQEKLSAEDRSWLQAKVATQRKALDVLNRKVLTQRFRLRVLAEMGRDLTKDEYLVAKEKLENQQVKERIYDYSAVA